MIAVAIAIAALAAAPVEGSFDRALACAMYAEDGTKRVVTGGLSFQDYEIRSFEIKDGEFAGRETYSKGSNSSDGALLYVALPSRGGAAAAPRTSRVYTLGRLDIRFGQAVMTIDMIREPRPNVVVSRSIIATGICNVSLKEKAA